MFSPAGPDDARLNAPAYHRNREAILGVLAPYLGAMTGDVLEAGSGTGQHILDFARAAPHLTWWPSEYSEAHLCSIAAYAAKAGLPNLRSPRRIDLSDPDWQWGDSACAEPNALAAIFCANVIHISPWAVAEGLFAGAARHLKPGGYLVLYGPFKRDGAHTAPSNEAFDTSLRAQNPAWGVRDMGDVEALAARNGLALRDAVPMPANNFTLVFEKNDAIAR
jgi:SAM-dependent methyltransferase